MRLIDKYILKELIMPFIFGVVAFSSLLITGTIMFKLVRMIVQENLPLEIAGQLFLLGLPKLILLTLPMSILLSCLLSFSRLSADNEIIAMEAGGISYYNICFAPLIFAFLVFLATVILQETLVPYTNDRYNKIFTQITSKNKILRKSGMIFYKELNNNELKRFIYAKDYDPENNELIDVVTTEFSSGVQKQSILAKKALWSENSWTFFSGILYNFDDKGQLKQVLNFSKQQAQISQKPQDILRQQKDTEELKTVELQQEIKLLKKNNVADLNYLTVELHLRFAIPATCFILALIGIPLGTQLRPSGSSFSIGISTLIIFGYYALTVIFTTIGKSGIINSIFSAWVTDIIFLTFGIFLLQKKGS